MTRRLPQGQSMIHGTISAYTNHHCRCETCRQVWSNYHKARRSTLAGTLQPNDPRHGSYHTYNNFACRCLACCQAAAKYRKAKANA